MHSTQRTAPVTWRMSASRTSGPRRSRRASTFAATGNAGSLKLMDSSVAGELVLCGLHELAVEGRADGKHDGTLGSSLLAERRGALDSFFRSGDDGLLGRVQIRRSNNSTHTRRCLRRRRGRVRGVGEGVHGGSGLFGGVRGVVGRSGR